MLISAPYLRLFMYWQLMLSEIGGQNTKTLALIAGAPFPFPFRAFLPLPLPFSAPVTQAKQEKLLLLKPGFHLLGKSQIIGDLTVSRLSQILPTDENSKS